MTDDTRDRLLMAVAIVLVGPADLDVWHGAEPHIKELKEAQRQAQRERNNPAEAR